MKRVLLAFAFVCAVTSLQASLVETIGRADFVDWDNIKSVDCGVVTISQGEEISYTYPGEGNRAHGFRTYYNGSDWSRYKGLSFEIYLERESPTLIELSFSVAEENKTLLEPLSTASVELLKEGWNRVYIPWSQFSLRGGQQGTLQGVKRFSLKALSKGNSSFEIRSVELLKAQTIALLSPKRGGAASSGGEVVYELEVGNTTSEPQTIQLSIPKMGWEAMQTTLSHTSLTLLPFQSRACELRVTLPESLPQGTNEVQRVVATINGTPTQSIEFTTSVRVASPYILHNAEGWAEVIQKTKDYEWAREDLSRREKEATAWQIPEIAKSLPSMNSYMGRYLFHHDQANKLMNCAIAYRLTGRGEYAQKCVDFLRVLVDEQSGYPSTLRVNQNNFVKEGGVFQNIARTYDMIYDSGLLSAEDHRLIEKSFRLFIDTVQQGTDDGGIGNWDLSELSGAFYCALMIQDFHLAKELLYAPTGIYQQFAQGVMSDGWWYECSVGYNLWCAAMFSEIGVALRPWGVNFLEDLIPVGKVSHYSLQPDRMKEGLYGMNFNKWGQIENNALRVKDMWDALVPFLDYRGVMFAVNDAQETSVIGEPFELAYYLFRDAEYASVIRMSGRRDLLYGVAELPDFESVKNKQSAYADNIGVVQLRSQKQGREQREQIQAALHYGSHGGYHGHFDRTNFLSMMRYGRSFYNPEMIWYGYQSYNYKFLVQTSMTKNMVVVDQKMQEPVESKRTMFYTGDMLQAAAVETTARWSNPPYGGMRYGDKGGYSFRQKAWEEGRTFNFADDEPEYGELSEFTEPILQRRAMVMMDDYVVLADYLSAQEEHTFDYLFHLKGLERLNLPRKSYLRHENQLSDNPLSAAQFFTNCDWFSTSGTIRLHSQMLFGEGSDNAGTRAPNSEDGVLNIDIFSAWPRKAEMTVATTPESHNVSKQLWYEVAADDEVILRDSTGAWILGQKEISLDIAGRKELRLSTTLRRRANNNTIFWGNAKVILLSGEEVDVASLPIKYINTLPTPSKGVDYYGGEVALGGERMISSLPAQPLQEGESAVVVIDLKGLDVARFEAVVGGDYPLGDESQRRRTLNVRTSGKQTQYLSVIEPYETTSQILSVEAKSEDKLEVTLIDGRRQEITISNMSSASEGIVVEVKEYDKRGKLLRKEITK